MRMRFLPALMALLLVTPAIADEEQRVARYTVVSQDELQDIDPLSVEAKLYFPREFVSSIGDALTHLFKRSGYSIAAADKDAERLLSLPLPESQRTIGPRQVRNIARTLIGNAYGLCINPLTREIQVAANGGDSTACPTPSKAKEKE